VILLISASQVAKRTGMSHWHQAFSTFLYYGFNIRHSEC
jgi:hypothetical protein